MRDAEAFRCRFSTDRILMRYFPHPPNPLLPLPAFAGTEKGGRSDSALQCCQKPLSPLSSWADRTLERFASFRRCTAPNALTPCPSQV
jgi:hypothetical protein